MTERTPLSSREQHALQHLRRAEELGTTLSYYATAYELDLQQLLNSQAQLERKGYWPPKAPPAKASVSEQRTQLLAVQVLPETTAPATDAEVSGEPRPGLQCRLRAPNGWVLECERWPQVEWLTALMAGVA